MLNELCLSVKCLLQNHIIIKAGLLEISGVVD